MLGRFFVLIAMMLFGPLFIEVYLYHPPIVLEHDHVALVPLVAAPLGLFGGFLLLAADNRATAALFAVICALAVATGVVGAAIHIAMHADSWTSLIADPNIWRGEPPPLVPLSFAASGGLGFLALAMPERRGAVPPVAIARILQAMAALCALVAAVAGALPEAGAIALIGSIAALGFGSFGFAAELVVAGLTLWRGRLA